MTVAELMEIVPGRTSRRRDDSGARGIRNAYSTGRGSIIMRASARIETTRKDRERSSSARFPISEQGGAGRAHRRSGARKENRGISDLRDESDRDGMRIVIELRREAVADVVLNQLWRILRCSRVSRSI